MKKKNQVYILLIILFLAIVTFLYYTYRIKTKEGIDGNEDGIDGNEDGIDGNEEEEEIITGEYVPMSPTNPNTISSVVRELEKDVDEEIPTMKKNDKKLSQRINSLQGRIAKLEKRMSSEDSKRDPTNEIKHNITHSQNMNMM